MSIRHTSPSGRTRSLNLSDLKAEGMTVRVFITGKRASGKSHLARQLKAFLSENAVVGTSVVIQSRLYPRAPAKDEEVFTVERKS